MNRFDYFYRAIGLEDSSSKEKKAFAVRAGMSLKDLDYYNQNNILPSGQHLERILLASGLTELELMLMMGRLNKSVISRIQAHAPAIAKLIEESFDHDPQKNQTHGDPIFHTDLGYLYEGDCVEILATLESDSVDLVFADPPFNLNKLYPSNIDDDLKAETYLLWSQEWLSECIRVLKPGGSLFLWNLPKWNSALSDYLSGRLMFRNWIGVDLKFSFPINGRLYPSHYSLLYYVKGAKPNTFHPDRLPMPTCRKCYNELKDYGGYKHKMNPLGINLTDIWTDIPPVRHAKYKRRTGANELSLKLLDRIIELATNVNDVVLDPFGGSGTTYMAAELKGRRWIGCELGPVETIIARFQMIDEEREILESFRSELNSLFPEPILAKREAHGLWTPESVRTGDDSTQLKLL